jgi:hypothetical protein
VNTNGYCRKPFPTWVCLYQGSSGPTPAIDSQVPHCDERFLPHESSFDTINSPDSGVADLNNVSVLPQAWHTGVDPVGTQFGADYISRLHSLRQLLAGPIWPVGRSMNQQHTTRIHTGTMWPIDYMCWQVEDQPTSAHPASRETKKTISNSKDYQNSLY